ncbi:hypothetical protein PISMIDRAFT_23861 [Pisolithus microcarpus 441]|uniref:Uncharacterized protein n=1 Tax=Pisolithus microcarpus 441 TaxID=765257 RepID=A0A0C9ZHA7_9AGAM|nr:hypothetical protein BKA83DRAFT_23861 [Pisolithus microcarpus]KIK21872.1 hypothetical protein PISMIDRAFT_23861 [Pisolithus microcarpus 441]
MDQTTTWAIIQEEFNVNLALLKHQGRIRGHKETRGDRDDGSMGGWRDKADDWCTGFIRAVGRLTSNLGDIAVWSTTLPQLLGTQWQQNFTLSALVGFSFQNDWHAAFATTSAREADDLGSSSGQPPSSSLISTAGKDELPVTQLCTEEGITSPIGIDLAKRPRDSRAEITSCDRSLLSPLRPRESSAYKGQSNRRRKHALGRHS